MTDGCPHRTDGLTCPFCYHAMLEVARRTGYLLPPVRGIPHLPPAETSTQLQGRIQEAARLLGGWDRFTVRRSDKAMVAAGFPDDLYLGHGRLLVIEYKNEKEKVTLPQQHWLEAFWFHDPHAECYVGWPSDEARLVDILKGATPQPRDTHWMTRLPHPVRNPLSQPLTEGHSHV